MTVDPRSAMTTARINPMPTNDFVNLISSVVYAVVLPFAAIAATYLYFDLCVAKQQEAETGEADDILPAEEAPPPVLAPR
jgi:hypothetical protein